MKQKLGYGPVEQRTFADYFLQRSAIGGDGLFEPRGAAPIWAVRSKNKEIDGARPVTNSQ